MPTAPLVTIKLSILISSEALNLPFRLLIDGANRSCSLEAIASPTTVQNGIVPSRKDKSGARKLCLYSKRLCTGPFVACVSNDNLDISTSDKNDVRVHIRIALKNKLINTLMIIAKNKSEINYLDKFTTSENDNENFLNETPPKRLRILGSISHNIISRTDSLN